MPSVSASARNASAQRMAWRWAVERGEVAVAGAFDQRAFEPLRELGS